MGILFAKGKKDPQTAPPSSGTPSGAVSARPRPSDAVSATEGEAALDTLGAVLRAFGASAFDLGDLDASTIRKLFERWSEHALVAAPLDSEAPGGEPVRRDWTALRQLVGAHRKREAAYVVTSLTNLREAVWSFVEIVNRATSQDKADGALARERLTRLRSALACSDIETLRREVSQTATAMEHALAEQHKKQQERIAEFAESVRSLGEQLESAKREGALDPLTRLPNRASFDEFLRRTVDLTALVGRSVALMMVDIDQFKAINDTLGHQAGDAAIKTIADCLVRRFPRRGDLVARYGGDEFAVVLGDTELKDARALAQRVVESVRAVQIFHNGHTIRLTCSIGLALFEDGDRPDSWLARADAALYLAKAGGRDRWNESASRAVEGGKRRTQEERPRAKVADTSTRGLPAVPPDRPDRGATDRAWSLMVSRPRPTP